MDTLQFLLPSLIVSFILVGIHVYLGVHVVERGVIFVDLALAQMAALGGVGGAVVGVTNPGMIYLWSLGFTFVGAMLFSLTRSEERVIPQEAIIGIVYAVSTALAVIVMSFSAEEAQHLKDMLVGNILTVSWHHAMGIALLYATVGAFHFIFRKPFLAASRGENKSRLWDFLFYGSFGVVVTSSVAVAGVLLVFTFLIVPAVCAMLFYERISHRLAFGWGVGFVASALGLWFSYLLDFPTGATMVCTFGLGLVLLASFRILTKWVRAKKLE